MGKHRKAEKGYSLVTTLLVFTLIGILGFILIGVVMQSITIFSHDKKAMTDKAHAEMAIEEAMAQIEREVALLNHKIETGIINSDNFSSMLEKSLHQIESLKPDIYSYTIDQTEFESEQENLIRKKVTITAPIGSSGKNIVKTIMLSTIADIFQYSLVSNGDLEMNGSPYIEGDMLVNGDLYSRNTGKYRLGSWKSIKTSFPALNGNLHVEGNYYYNKEDWQTNADRPFECTGAESLNKYFSIAPKLKDKEIAFNQINVSELVQEKKATKLELDEERVRKVTVSYSKLNDGTIPHSMSYYDLFINSSGSVIINGDLEVRNDLVMWSNGKLHVKGNVYINDDLVMHPGAQLTVDGSVYVRGKGTGWSPTNLSGKLTLTSPNSYIYIDKNLKTKDLDFKGTMFVEGHVKIRGDFNTNGTIYVMKDKKTSIENMSNLAGTLVIASDGEIDVSNNNQYVDEPRILHTYLYSTKKLEIFGIGSHLQIHGGMYGNPVVLNAVKGNVRKKGLKLSFENNQDAIDPKKSRLSIYYDKNMILNPPIGIPTVSKVNIKELNTVYE